MNSQVNFYSSLKTFTFEFSKSKDQKLSFDMSGLVNEDEDEMLKRAIAISLDEQSAVVEEEMLISVQQPGELSAKLKSIHN